MYSKLRKEAEQIIKKIKKTTDINTEELDKVLHELKVHQIELELQNEELRLASQQQEISNRRFSDLFDHAPVGYLLIDQNFHILNINFSAASMLRCERSKLKGKKITHFVNPAYQDKFYLHIAQVLESENLQSTEIKFKECSDTFFDAGIQSIKEYDASDNTHKIRIAVIDISQRKNIEKSLKRFRAAIDSSADNIFLIDYSSKQFIDVNESVCRNLGFSREEFLKLKPTDLNPIYSESFIDKFLEDNSHSDKPTHHTLETKHIRSDGSVANVEVFLKCTHIEDEKIIVAIARDITERKKTEEKLALYANELKELNHSKDKFLSIISHDLRGPFLGIKGYTQLLIEDFDFMEKEEIMDYLNIIHTSTRDLYTLVDNLLKWSRLELGKMPYEPMSFNLYDELEAVIKLIAGIAAKKDIRFENALQKHHFPHADRLMVISVVQNLLSNAIKFTRKGGYVKISSGIKGNKIVVSVSDNGVGISPEVNDKLFTLDKSYTSKGTAGEKGTGFGLLIAKEMINKMQGEIWVESKLQKGSTFFFTLINSKDE